MTSSSHPRFRLLMGWCCLMTSALLIIIVYLAVNLQQAEKKDRKSGNQETNSTVIDGKNAQQTGLGPGQPFIYYIHLIRDHKEIWTCHPCKDSIFHHQHSTVNITVSGLYSFHAQVTFKRFNNPANSGTVTLRQNKVPGKQERILSQVTRTGLETATLMRLVELTNGDSISLEISPNSTISDNAYDTYWEIVFLKNK